MIESNIVDWNMSANLVRPIHLENLPGRVVFEGNLKELRQEDKLVPGIVL